MNDGRSSVRFESIESRRLFSAYFIDASHGSDTALGNSPATAWRTLAEVSKHNFKSGDSIYLTGTFVNQTLALGPAANGVLVDTYTVGSGNTLKWGVPNAAEFTDEQRDGIDITTSNVTVRNLTITADPKVGYDGNYAYGVFLHNATSSQLTNDTINNIIAGGFSYSGLCMQGWNGTTTHSAGFSNVVIENSSFYDNGVSGIFAGAGDSTGVEFQPNFPASLYLNNNLTINNCKAFNNAGYNGALQGKTGDQYNRGSETNGGIFISSVAGATVEHCVTYNNCFTSKGGVGTWAFDAENVLFQNDESYDTKTTQLDGDGFDFDHGVIHSLMQDDYAHGNAGVGFLLATTGGSSNDVGDTIRYCVADDNHGGIYIGTPAGVPALDENIYNNTVLINDPSGQFIAAVGVQGGATSTTTANFLDNIFYNAGTNPIIELDAAAKGVQFERNDYWRAGAKGAFKVEIGKNVYTSLAAWIKASPGEETLNGKTIALIQDPELVNEKVSDLPTSQVANLMLAGQSPLRREGEALATPAFDESAPYNADAPYNLAGPAWDGLGQLDFFGQSIDPQMLGAG